MYCNFLEESRSKVVVVGPEQFSPEPGWRRSRSPSWPVLLDRALPSGVEGQEPAAPQGSLRRFRPQVTLIVQDEAARVLDTRSGRFYALDAIGTRMLFTALEMGAETMVRALAPAYQVPESQVFKDWRALVAGLHKAGLTEAVRLSPHPPPAPGGLGIWVQLTLACLSFWLLGWERTLSIWRRRSHRHAVRMPDDWPAMVAQVDGPLRRIASRHPLNPQCKERALVSWHLLKRRGLPARLFMGVMLYPFAAHAWTECHGQVVGDDQARCEQFVPVAIYE
jgi:hypothetical protein